MREMPNNYVMMKNPNIYKIQTEILRVKNPNSLDKIQYYGNTVMLAKHPLVNNHPTPPRLCSAPTQTMPTMPSRPSQGLATPMYWQSPSCSGPSPLWSLLLALRRRTGPSPNCCGGGPSQSDFQMYFSSIVGEAFGVLTLLQVRVVSLLTIGSCACHTTGLDDANILSD